jgi:hypothetical protein
VAILSPKNVRFQLRDPDFSLWDICKYLEVIELDFGNFTMVPKGGLVYPRLKSEPTPTSAP